MKPFTEQEMIQVAEAAGKKKEFKYTKIGGNISLISTINGFFMSLDVSNNYFSLKRNKFDVINSYDTLAVSDTIRQIIKEREA